MTIAEKFIAIWLDGDNEKATSMMENNDWIEITAKRLEEILDILINQDCIGRLRPQMSNMVTFGQCYIFALEFFGSRGINLSEAQMSEFCYSLLAFTTAAQQSTQDKKCLCGDPAVINDTWCEACFPDTGR